MKTKLFLTTTFLILVNLSCFAQLENPCGGNGDPDAPSTCPLDTWVLLLVAAFLIYATVKLYRKQKSYNPTHG
ncbi:MAG: hypothetical protein ACXVAY_03840 [Mucilaginibacter sp.]